MLAGHYAPALALKAAAPRVPLWMLFVAVQLVDIAWSVFVVTGVEVARIEPGYTASNGLVLERVAISHSLVAAGAWALGAGLLAGGRLRDRGAGAVIAVAVASHWLLDLPMHVPDLPLADPDGVKFGLGLWHHRAASFGLEAGLLLLAGWAFLSRIEPRRGAWRTLAVTLGILAVAGYYGPQPTGIAETGLTGLGVYLALPFLAARVDGLSRRSAS